MQPLPTGGQRWDLVSVALSVAPEHSHGRWYNPWLFIQSEHSFQASKALLLLFAYTLQFRGVFHVWLGALPASWMGVLRSSCRGKWHHLELLAHQVCPNTIGYCVGLVVLFLATPLGSWCRAREVHWLSFPGVQHTLLRRLKFFLPCSLAAHLLLLALHPGLLCWECQLGSVFFSRKVLNFEVKPTQFEDHRLQAQRCHWHRFA